MVKFPLNSCDTKEDNRQLVYGMLTTFLSLFSLGNDLRDELTMRKKESVSQMFQSQSNTVMDGPHICPPVPK